MFSKEKAEELKIKIRNINKLKTADERLSVFIEYKNIIHTEINDELDEIFSAVNLKKNKEE